MITRLRKWVWRFEWAIRGPENATMRPHSLGSKRRAGGTTSPGRRDVMIRVVLRVVLRCLMWAALFAVSWPLVSVVASIAYALMVLVVRVVGGVGLWESGWFFEGALSRFGDQVHRSIVDMYTACCIDQSILVPLMYVAGLGWGYGLLVQGLELAREKGPGGKPGKPSRTAHPMLILIPIASVMLLIFATTMYAWDYRPKKRALMQRVAQAVFHRDDFAYAEVSYRIRPDPMNMGGSDQKVTIRVNDGDYAAFRALTSNVSFQVDLGPGNTVTITDAFE